MIRRPHKVNSLTAFIPCFNEDQNLVPMVAALLEVLPQIATVYELIIINDGSRDHTAAVAEKLVHDHPIIRVIHHPRNLGYGASLQTGFKSARYDWTFFTDSDRQFDVHELIGFIPYTADYQAIIGYRRKRIEGGLRVVNARLYNFFIDLLFRVGVKDIDCAFKLIRTEALQSITYISTGATISAELLYRLKKKHILFKQLPVRHYARIYGNSTGNHPKVVLKAGFELIKLYLSMKFGLKLS